MKISFTTISILQKRRILQALCTAATGAPQHSNNLCTTNPELRAVESPHRSMSFAKMHHRLWSTVWYTTHKRMAHQNRHHHPSLSFAKMHPRLWSPVWYTTHKRTAHQNRHHHPSMSFAKVHPRQRTPNQGVSFAKQSVHTLAARFFK